METKVTSKIIRCLEDSAMALNPSIIECLAQIRRDVLRRAADRERNSAHAILSKLAVLRDIPTP